MTIPACEGAAFVLNLDLDLAMLLYVIPHTSGLFLSPTDASLALADYCNSSTKPAIC